MGFLAGALGNVWAKIIAVGAIVAALLVACAKIFSAGKTSAVAEGQREQLKNVSVRDEVDSLVAARSDDANRKRLLGRWTRS